MQDFPDTTRRFLLTVNAVDMAVPPTAAITVEGAVASASAQIAVLAGASRSQEVVAYNAGGVVLSRGATADITVNAGQTTSVTLTMATQVGDVSGTVDNLNTGAGYEGVTIECALATTSTDASGSFLLRDVASGSQTISYTAPGGGTPAVQPIAVYVATTSVASPVALFGSGPAQKSSAASTLYTVAALSATQAIVGGSYNSSPTYAQLHKTTGGGATWSSVECGMGGYGLAVFDALNIGVSVGSSYKTSADGGLTTAATYATPEVIKGLWPVSPSILWGTSGGKVYRSVDGGVTWTAALTVNTGGYHSLAAADASTAVVAASSGKIYQTVDGGDNWTVVYDPPDPTALAAITRLGTGWIAVGTNRAVIKAPGASNWVTQANSWTLNDIDCLADASACWACGASGRTVKF